jgi:hypothetical protein
LVSVAATWFATTAALAMLLAAVDMVSSTVLFAVVVDRGHRRSNQKTEASFWVYRPRPSSFARTEHIAAQGDDGDIGNAAQVGASVEDVLEHVANSYTGTPL